jgi:cyclic pyranopterin phosphate synthase
LSKNPFSHLNEEGQAQMVDVSLKPETQREALATGYVILGNKALNLLTEAKIPKGNVLTVAKVAGILAAKKVEDLIPLCHPLPLQDVEIGFRADQERGAIEISARVKARGVTGVEMEALTAVSVAALTIYDMCKSVEKGIVIEKIRLEYKSGGKSGSWTRKV